MPKYIIKEERLNEFMSTLFKYMAKKQGQKVAKKVQNDPKLKAWIKQGDDLADKIEKHIKDRKEDDPEYAAASDAYDRFLKS